MKDKLFLINPKNKMRKKISYALICLIVLSAGNSFSETNFDPKLRLNDKSDYSKLIKERDYEKAVRFHKKITNSILGLSLDLQLGYGTTNASGEATNSKSVSSSTKGGFTTAAILNLSLFDAFNFSTGLDFTKKNFGIGVPYVNPQQTGDSIIQNLENNYLNIPMNVFFGGMVSENVGVYFNGGPYFGILMNAENAASGFKNFDLGVNGTITGKYFFNPFLAAILGTKIMYGGLNNLWNSDNVETLHTINWGAFTGLSVGF